MTWLVSVEKRLLFRVISMPWAKRHDDGVIRRSVDQKGAGLALTQEAIRVREMRAERDVSGLVVELGLDRAALAEIGELAPVR